MAAAISLVFWLVYHNARFGKGSGSSNNYFLAGKGLGTLLLSFSVMATQMGGTMFIGTVAIARKCGWQAMYYPVGMAVGLLLVGLFVGKRLNALGVSTTSEIFKKIYKSDTLHYLSSCTSIFSLFFILVVQMVGASKLLSSLGYTDPAIFYLLWFTIIGYTALGGLRSVVVTDFFQILFIFLVVITVPFFVDYSMASKTAILPLMELKDDIFTLCIMPSLFMIIGQDMGQRCFAGKSKDVVSTSFIISAIGIAIVGYIVVFLGVQSRFFEIDDKLSPILSIISNPVVFNCVALAIIVAIVSTADSLLCAISSNIAVDIVKGKSVFFAQLLTACIGGLALVLEKFDIFNIVRLIGLGYGSFCCSFAVPTLAIFVMKKHYMSAATFSVAGGMGGFILFDCLLKGYIPYSTGVALACSVIGYAIGHAYESANDVACNTL